MKEYTHISLKISYKRSNFNNIYYGHLVDFPGVMSEGKTIKELVNNIEDAHKTLLTYKMQAATLDYKFMNTQLINKFDLSVMLFVSIVFVVLLFLMITGLVNPKNFSPLQVSAFLILSVIGAHFATKTLIRTFSKK